MKVCNSAGVIFDIYSVLALLALRSLLRNLKCEFFSYFLLIPLLTQNTRMSWTLSLR